MNRNIMFFEKLFQDAKSFIQVISLIRISSEHRLFAQTTDEAISDVFKKILETDTYSEPMTTPPCLALSRKIFKICASKCL